MQQDEIKINRVIIYTVFLSIHLAVINISKPRECLLPLLDRSGSGGSEDTHVTGIKCSQIWASPVVVNG